MSGLEVIGSVASVLQLAATVYSISRTLYEVGGALSNAPSEIKDLARDLETFSEELNLLSSLLSDKTHHYSDRVYRLTAKIIGDCASICVKIDRILRKLRSGSFLSRVKWVFKEKEIMKLLVRLRDLKLSLMGTLSLLSALKADHLMNVMGVGKPSLLERSSDEKLSKVTEDQVEETRKALASISTTQETEVSLSKTTSGTTLVPSISQPTMENQGSLNLGEEEEALAQTRSTMSFKSYSKTKIRATGIQEPKHFEFMSAMALPTADVFGQLPRAMKSVKSFHSALSRHESSESLENEASLGKKLDGSLSTSNPVIEKWRSEMAEVAMKNFNMDRVAAESWAAKLPLPDLSNTEKWKNSLREREATNKRLENDSSSLVQRSNSKTDCFDNITPSTTENADESSSEQLMISNQQWEAINKDRREICATYRTPILDEAISPDTRKLILKAKRAKLESLKRERKIREIQLSLQVEPRFKDLRFGSKRKPNSKAPTGSPQNQNLNLSHKPFSSATSSEPSLPMNDLNLKEEVGSTVEKVGEFLPGYYYNEILRQYELSGNAQRHATELKDSPEEHDMKYKGIGFEEEIGEPSGAAAQVDTRYPLDPGSFDTPFQKSSSASSYYNSEIYFDSGPVGIEDLEIWSDLPRRSDLAQALDMGYFGRGDERYKTIEGSGHLSSQGSAVAVNGDSKSDLEADVGLEAMRIAESQMLELASINVHSLTQDVEDIEERPESRSRSRHRRSNAASREPSLSHFENSREINEMWGFLTKTSELQRDEVEKPAGELRENISTLPTALARTDRVRPRPISNEGSISRSPTEQFGLEVAAIDKLSRCVRENSQLWFRAIARLLTLKGQEFEGLSMAWAKAHNHLLNPFDATADSVASLAASNLAPIINKARAQLFEFFADTATSAVASIDRFYNVMKVIKETLNFKPGAFVWICLWRAEYEIIQNKPVEKILKDGKTLADIAEVATLVARYNVLESMYQHWDGMSLHQEYEESLIDLCVKVLKYLNSALTGGSDKEKEDLILSIREADTACRKFSVTISEAENIDGLDARVQDAEGDDSDSSSKYEDYVDGVVVLEGLQGLEAEVEKY